MSPFGSAQYRCQRQFATPARYSFERPPHVIRRRRINRMARDASPVFTGFFAWPALELLPAAGFRQDKHLCISLLTMRTSEKWSRNIKALEQFVNQNGHALVPASAKMEVDGVVVSLGSWVSYLRMKHRSGRLSLERKAQLEQFPNWAWGPCKPGPTGDAQRDEAMLLARNAGRSLQSIADEYGLSRQRVHQILRRTRKPVLANA